jgi:UDP-glucose 4-epimerase
MEIKGNKFVVTGGAGLIGSHIVDQALSAGASEIIILDTLIRGNIDNIAVALGDPRVHLYKADIRDAQGIKPYFAGAAGCFHLAALRITQCAAEPRHALEVMIDGTYNVLEACVEQSIKKVVFSSSASIYGMADSFPTSESHHPYNNNTWYGAAKMCGEGMLRSFKDMFGLAFIALRYFNVYGPRMDASGKYTEVLIRWMDCFCKGERPAIFGDGKQTMDFVYVEDIARANIRAMQSEVSDEAFNIATGTEVSLLELLRALANAWGAGLFEPELLPARSVNPVPRRLASVEKAERLLDFSATTTLDEGLNKLIEWYKSNRIVCDNQP